LVYVIDNFFATELKQPAHGHQFRVVEVVNVGVLSHCGTVNSRNGGGDALATVSRWDDGFQFDSVLRQIATMVRRNDRDIVSGHRQTFAFPMKNSRIECTMD